MTVHAGRARIAGRLQERGVLEAAVARAARGEPSAVFVLGEAGVGKTQLVRAAAEAARDHGFAVLWGRCLRFGAVESVLLPWVVALEGWLASAVPAERRRVLEAVPGAAQLLPSLGGGALDDRSRLLSVAESLLAQVSALRPTLLVMDDVQWADAASRDALSYLVAGFAGQRQLLLATCRDEGVADGDPLFGWMADLRRMPSVLELTLGRLGREETEEQLALLLGSPPAPGLVDAVQRKSGGNAYLSELLAQGLDPHAEDLPRGVPSDLSAALLAAWHRLGPATREVLRVLAVAGRPVRANRLVDVCATCGMDPADVRRSLAEAVVSGTLVPGDDGGLWLRHPLLAEVLTGTYLPGESAPVHRAWAAGLEAGPAPATGPDAVRRLGDIALHRERAGDLELSFSASMLAAEAARASRLWREEPVHLQRATRLWPEIGAESRGELDETDLLERAAIASARVGRGPEAVALGRRALALARAAGDPLRTSRLLIWCEGEAWWLGERDEEPLAAASEAVELARERPDSREYAEALAALADGLAWQGRWREAAPIADQAVAAARRSGSSGALSIALGARSMGANGRDGDEDSREGWRHAVLSGDPDRVQWGAQWRINVLLVAGRLREATDLARWALDSALETGALAAALWHAGDAAKLSATQGRLADAAEIVRTGLSLTGVGNGAAGLRLAAMVVAVRRGDLDAAAMHLRRAEEQIPSLRLRPGLEAPPMIAELLLAQRRPADALVLLITTMEAQCTDRQVTDLMTVYGIRAAADLMQASRDRRDRRAGRQARTLLHRLARGRDRLLEPPFTSLVAGDPVLPARRAERDAEVARFDGRVAPDLWAEAVRRCASAGLGWEEQLANVRWGASLLAAGASRAEAAAPLRAAHRYAVAEGAAGMLRDIEAIATAGRLLLDEPVSLPLPQQRTTTSVLERLTGREREVLSHLVAGRTYAEIAGDLVISEKTVSTHVSNLLRKTGTSSRRQVSALALRLSETEDRPP